MNKVSKKRASSSAEQSVGLDRGIEKLESRRDSKEDRRVAGALKGQKVRGWTEKLLTRVMSGVIYVVVIVGCLFWGPLPTAALMSTMGWVCCSEFFRITRMAGRRPNEILGLSAAFIYPIAGLLLGPSMLTGVTCLIVLSAAIWYVFSPRVNISDVAITVFGPLYTSLTLATITLVRASDAGMQGAFLTLVVIGAIWIEDSAAYLVGSTLGKHKMAPRTSPNKSWEGFYAGIAASILVWVVAAIFHVGGIGWVLALSCGISEAIVSVLGDLFESRIKRGVGVKDSGNLLPGHGGLLDRTDSMLLGGIVVFFIMALGGVL